MARNLFIITILVIFCFIIYRLIFRSSPTDTINLKIKNQDYVLEVAESMSQKSIGLMNRTSLCPNCGMIFVSSWETPQIFWMKSTLIPLDIIFLDHIGKIINIEEANPEPTVADINLKLYRSSSPSQYIIELNRGDSRKLNLLPGDQIKLPQL